MDNFYLEGFDSFADTLTTEYGAYKAHAGNDDNGDNIVFVVASCKVDTMRFTRDDLIRMLALMTK